MLAAAPPTQYVGHTTEGRRLVLQVRGRVVTGVRVGVRRYRCETFDDVGPVIVSKTGQARIGRDGRFRFTAGADVQRLVVAGRVARGGGVRGTVRLTGTIATGQRCASATLRYRATRSPV
jgi:hypothetical protein